MLAYPYTVRQVVVRILKVIVTKKCPGVEDQGWDNTAWKSCVMVLECSSGNVNFTVWNGLDILIRFFCSLYLLDQPH